MNDIINKEVFFKSLGTVSYKEAWDFQTCLFEEIVQIKLNNRNLPVEQQAITPNHLLFCEHPHVYTLGKSGAMSHLLLNEAGLKNKQAEFFHINRGGDITYHGPGQIVGYPILDLDNFFTDIHKYLRFLEEAVIQTLKHYDIEAGRIDGLTGVWIDFQQPGLARKICALGVKTSRWVTMHGFAFNVNPDLSYFENIIPCGISDKAVTSMEKELGKKVNISEVQSVLLEKIADIFEMKIIE
ncbi:MAG: lipoyl(octanoyl) transferase LipB [Cytophagaceae bacterium]